MFKDDLKNFAVTYRHIYAATAPLHRLAIYRFLLAEAAGTASLKSLGHDNA